jgi:hypothetical protein
MSTASQNYRNNWPWADGDKEPIWADNSYAHALAKVHASKWWLERLNGGSKLPYPDSESYNYKIWQTCLIG